jgi:hypothetical protein
MASGRTTLLSNIRLCQKRLKVRNALAYSTLILITNYCDKNFIADANGLKLDAALV